jgi:hypothetical protein
MNKAELDQIRASAAASAPRLYTDLYSNLAYSWGNYLDKMLNATVDIAQGNDASALNIVKGTQSGNVQQQYDQGYKSFGPSVFFLIILTTRPGILDWQQLDNIVRWTYKENISGLAIASNNWGPNVNGPSDLPTTVRTFAILIEAANPGVVIQHPEVTFGALRAGFDADPVKLFSIVHQYVPAP